MRYIMDTKDQPHERPTQGTNGNYPEISFTFVSNTIEGLMGIKPNAHQHKVITASHLPTEISWIEAKHLMIGQQELTIRHEGSTSTTLSNLSSKPITWEAWFYGNYHSLNIGQETVTSQQKYVNGRLVSYVDVLVQSGETLEINR